MKRFRRCGQAVRRRRRRRRFRRLNSVRVKKTLRRKRFLIILTKEFVRHARRAPHSLISIIIADRGGLQSGRFVWKGSQKRQVPAEPATGSCGAENCKLSRLCGRCARKLDPVVEPVTGSANQNERFAWEALQKRQVSAEPATGVYRACVCKPSKLRGRCARKLDPVVDPVTGSKSKMHVLCGRGRKRDRFRRNFRSSFAVVFLRRWQIMGAP